MRYFMLVVAIGAMVQIACGQQSGTVTVQPQPEPTTYSVTLFCEDCAEIGIEIILWKNPNSHGIVGSVPHNPRAIILDSAVYNNVLHYNTFAKNSG